MAKETVEDETSRRVSVGDISATFVPPGADRNYRVEFRLFGTVKAKDLAHLEELYADAVHALSPSAYARSSQCYYG